MPDKTIFVTPDANLQGTLTSAQPGDILQLYEGEYRTKCTIFVPGITACAALRTAHTDPIFILWASTNGTTLTGTAPRDSMRRPLSRAA